MESNEQNKTRGIDTWKRLTDLKGDKGWRDWKRLAEEHICICAWPVDTDDTVVKAKWEGVGWKRVSRGGRDGGHL